MITALRVFGAATVGAAAAAGYAIASGLAFNAVSRGLESAPFLSCWQRSCSSACSRGQWPGFAAESAHTLRRFSRRFWYSCSQPASTTSKSS